MKKENKIITEPDNLTEEQLEKVLGGAFQGQTSQSQSSYITGKSIGIDSTGSSVFTVDN